MPTYEYACRDCGEHVEVFQSFRDDPLTVCGLCGGRLRKVFSAAGIVFKGSGYYVTDSRKAPASDSGGADRTSGDEGKGEGKGKGNADGSKPAKGGGTSKPDSPVAESA